MNENTRIANALREASANIHEIQNKGCASDLEINEQLANEMLELERILGGDTTRPEGFTFERLAHLIDPTDQLVNTQIVRCKDCIFYDTVHLDCARRGWTDCDRNGFCSYGERKEVKNAIS